MSQTWWLHNDTRRDQDAPMFALLQQCIIISLWTKLHVIIITVSWAVLIALQHSEDQFEFQKGRGTVTITGVGYPL